MSQSLNGNKGSVASRAREPEPVSLLQTLVELTDEAVIICSASGAVTSFSESAQRLCGRRAGEVQDRPIAELFSAHLRPEIERVMRAVTAGERVRHYETEFIRSDGLPVPVSLSISQLFREDGASFGSMVVARDVTEQRLAQAALDEVEGRLEESEALAHVGSWLWDLRTDVVQWSSEFHRIHGIDPQDFDGTFESYMSVVAPPDRVGLRAAMEAATTESAPLDFEYLVERKNGEPLRVVHIHARPTRGSDGHVVGLRGIGRLVS